MPLVRRLRAVANLVANESVVFIWKQRCHSLARLRVAAIVLPNDSVSFESNQWCHWLVKRAEPFSAHCNNIVVIRLLQRLSLVALGLSVGYETRPPIGWHHPFVIGWCKYTSHRNASRTHHVTGGSVLHFRQAWASCQIRKIAGCACAGNAGNVFPATVG